MASEGSGAPGELPRRGPEIAADIRSLRPLRTRGVRMDIDRYVERAGRLDLTGIDFDAFRRTPLDPDVLRCLRYMHDVEHHTVCYLRDLLVTPAHRDPRVTTFLTVWHYEEMWHGDALGRVLAAHGEEAGPARIDRMRRGLGVRDRLAPTLHA